MTSAPNGVARNKAAAATGPDELAVVATIETTLMHVEDLVRFVRKQDIDAVRISFPDEH